MLCGYLVSDIFTMQTLPLEYELVVSLIDNVVILHSGFM